MSNRTQVTLQGPIDLIALVPHLLGYQPGNGDVVVIGVRDDAIVMTACTDFGNIPLGHEQDAVVAALAGPIGHTRIDVAAIVGYGDPDHVGAAMNSLRDFLSAHDIQIIDAVRVSGQRYYPHLPAGWEQILPAAMDGVRFDTTTATVTATMVLGGSVAQPTRSALVDQFCPATGTERAEMHAATLRARHRLQHLTAVATDPAAAIALAGRTAADLVYSRHNSGDRLTDDEVAWLTVLLTDGAVRGHVWQRTHGHNGHVTLWTDLTRRADPDLVAAPASLLAFAAWLTGDGVVAGIALQRALDADPTHVMANLLRAALDAGIPPTAIRQHFQFAEDPLNPNAFHAG